MTLSNIDIGRTEGFLSGSEKLLPERAGRPDVCSIPKPDMELFKTRKLGPFVHINGWRVVQFDRILEHGELATVALKCREANFIRNCRQSTADANLRHMSKA